MDLIIGGVYQGKLAYAKEHFGVREDEIFTCRDAPVLDLSYRCYDGLERYLRACLRENTEPRLDFPADAVIIFQDIFCGIVPASAEERRWREKAGQTLNALAAEAETVTRIFCGIPQKLKPSV